MVCVPYLLTALLASRIVAQGYSEDPADQYDEGDDCYDDDGDADYGVSSSIDFVTSSKATGQASMTARSSLSGTTVSEASSFHSLSSASVQLTLSTSPSVFITTGRASGSIQSASSGSLIKSISRPSSIGLVSGSSKPIPLSCPSFSTSTFTTTKTLTELVYNSVVTINSFTVPVVTVSGSDTYTDTFVTYASTSTSYYDVTSLPTTTTIIVVPATSTTTIPTSAGFTPISCLPVYLNPTATTYVTTTRSTFVYVTSVSTAPTYTSTMTPYTTAYITSPVFTDIRVPTYTVTETRTADRVYAACATNNIASVAPEGSTFYTVNGNGTGVLTVSALDAVDCCNLCQADTMCTGNAFNSYIHSCQLFRGPVCDASRVGETARYDADYVSLTISNSGCGQFDLVHITFPRD